MATAVAEGSIGQETEQWVWLREEAVEARLQMADVLRGELQRLQARRDRIRALHPRGGTS